ncbi:hypothetical protein EJ04DRAFT_563394 [Polyplosphaeria fusca]|uniref:Uncharacterized protein n=1 Tax=Polyplosphaeria fusca TaxID=682080 RepID=A0A9P4V4I2_9PLEO|nr:hypothetical protein EJ04DRAFT_563394 [Polyplosphaeria fusca]
MAPTRLHIHALLALVATTTALEFHHARPTPTTLQRFSADGFSPKPTGAPSRQLELFKRQEDEDDPSFCGYLEGDFYYPMGCDESSTCMYDMDYGWFGCCSGVECAIATACVQSAVSEASDPLVTACTDYDYPECLVFQSVVDGSTYSHFECDVEQTTFELLPTASDDASSMFFETTEDFFTDEPTTTRERSSRATFSLDMSSSEESSITEDSALSTTTAGATASEATQAASVSSSSTGGAAVRTAEAAAGAVGGIVGLLALL